MKSLALFGMATAVLGLAAFAANGNWIGAVIAGALFAVHAANWMRFSS